MVEYHVTWRTWFGAVFEQLDYAIVVDCAKGACLNFKTVTRTNVDVGFAQYLNHYIALYAVLVG
jgi:hypothetical protein